MPTPAGHTLAALAAWAAARPLKARALACPWFWLAVLSACMPDLDFLPGIVLGNESIFHRGPGHSIGGALVYGGAVTAAMLAFRNSRRDALLAFSVAAGLYVGHLLLDLVGHDPGPPHGMQILWPLTSEYFISPIVIFPNLDRHPFDISVVARGVPVLAFETALLAPVVAAAAWARRHRNGNSP